MFSTMECSDYATKVQTLGAYTQDYDDEHMRNITLPLLRL